MAETIKDKVADAGQMVADAAMAVGQKIADGAGKAAKFVKEKAGLGTPAEDADPGGTHIGAGLDVIASCGQKVGVVDQMEGEMIKLTSPDGLHHYIPAKWVERVDKHVHLKKNAQETEQGWKTPSGD